MCWLRLSVALFATDYDVSEFGEIDSTREAIVHTENSNSAGNARKLSESHLFSHALSWVRWRLDGDDDRFCGVYSQGDTLEEAMANIQGAKIAWMEMAWGYGDEISLLSQF
jgi:hypothetical protein